MLFSLNSQARIKSDFYERRRVLKSVESGFLSLHLRFFKHVEVLKPNFKDKEFFNFLSYSYYDISNQCENINIEKCNETLLNFLAKYAAFANQSEDPKQINFFLDSQGLVLKQILYQKDIYSKIMVKIKDNLMTSMADLTSESEHFYHFWKDFIFPSFFFVTSEKNFMFLSKSFNSLNKAVYDYAHAIHSLNKIDNYWREESTIVINQWNIIRKSLYYDSIK
jgi:hypothetical protein